MFNKKMAGLISQAVIKVLDEQRGAGKEGDAEARRKDNMAGMAIEAKKGGLMKKGKMEMAMKGGKKVPAFLAKSGMADKMGRAVKRKTADAKGRAMKGK